MKILVTFASAAIMAGVLLASANALADSDSQSDSFSDSHSNSRGMSGMSDRLAWIFSDDFADHMGGLGSSGRHGSLQAFLDKLREHWGLGAFNPGNNVSPSPEPEVFALLSFGLALILTIATRRRKANLR